MSLREQVEKRIGKVTQSEFDFATTNLNLEIDYKFKSIPSVRQMRDILIANIEFYRKRKNLIMEG